MSLSPLDPDEILVERARGGELEAFEGLMRRHNERVYRVARAIVSEEWLVEEVMQEAYLSAFSHLAQFEGRSRFSTWLTRIVVNEARSQLRRRAQPTASLEDEAMSLSHDRDPEKLAARRELAQLIEGAVDELPEPLRLVFVLRDVEGLSTSEVADDLELSEENVRVRLHRAREALRDRLREHVDAVTTEAFPFHRPRCDRVVNAVLGRIGRGH
jgi:RNA polymerase sigma-70 factor (ECF subfamily)